MSLSLKSRLGKLKAMSFAELASRASYAGLLTLERRQVNGHWRSVSQNGRGDRAQRVIAARRAATERRFFAGLESPEVMRALFSAAGPYAEQARNTARAADAAKRHEFDFFGQRFTYGPEIDWHADPVTRRSWPVIFHRDVPIHEGATIGDVKYVWELNRHQFLIDLGKAYWLFGDADAAASVYRIVRGWIEQNPYGVGVNWSCALEPAFRVWSWLWAYHFCAGDAALDEGTHALWLTSFEDHGRFLYRHLEYYSSPYNHLIGEASALYALGLMFPEMPEAVRWRRRGRHTLESKVEMEFHADGSTVEQSTFYHHATLGFYILAAVLGERNGDLFPPKVHTAIEQGIEFSMGLMQPDGRVPSIGGADDGKCIRLERLPFWDFRPFQSFGAVRYQRPEFRFAAGEFFEDALWLLGPTARDRFFALPLATPAVSSAMHASGYYVLRSGWTPEADYVCFDCGEQAAGLRRDDVPSAAHGHADCLSIVLWLRGRPVLVDPGFYCYNGDPAWEVHFRKTCAHNTATVDRHDQSRHVHKMTWSRVFAPQVEAWLPADLGGAVAGCHDGYARAADGVIHRRAVWLLRGGCCVICDQFAGSGEHEIEINYQFAPGSATLSGDSALLFDSAELAWTGSAVITSAVRCGEPHAGGGWVAPSLGVRVAAPRLTLRSIFEPPLATYLALMAPRHLRDERRTVVGRYHDRLSIGLQSPEGGMEWFGVPLTRSLRSATELISSLNRSRQVTSGVASASSGAGRATAQIATELSLKLKL